MTDLMSNYYPRNQQRAFRPSSPQEVFGFSRSRHGQVGTGMSEEARARRRGFPSAPSEYNPRPLPNGKVKLPRIGKTMPGDLAGWLLSDYFGSILAHMTRPLSNTPMGFTTSYNCTPPLRTVTHYSTKSANDFGHACYTAQAGQSVDSWNNTHATANYWQNFIQLGQPRADLVRHWHRNAGASNPDGSRYVWYPPIFPTAAPLEEYLEPQLRPDPAEKPGNGADGEAPKPRPISPGVHSHVPGHMGYPGTTPSGYVDPRNPTPPPNPGPPDEDTKETKWDAAAAWMKLTLMGLEKLTELRDFIEVAIGALPKKLQRKAYSMTDAQKIMLLLQNLDKIDVNELLTGIVANLIEDAIVGGTVFKTRSDVVKWLADQGISPSVAYRVTQGVGQLLK